MIRLGTAALGALRTSGCMASVAVAATLLTATPARPGAWPREKGHVFLSSGMAAWRQDGTPGTDATFYAEAGIGKGWLLGLDATWKGRGGHDVLFSLGHARRLRRGPALSWALGVGQRSNPGAPTLIYLRPAIAWGRGFDKGVRLGRLRMPWSGWISAEAQAELWLTPGRAVPKLDLTLGLNLSERWTVMAELWADAYPGARPSLRLGPAVIARLGKRRLKLQPEIPLAGGGEARLNLALWSEF